MSAHPPEPRAGCCGGLRRWQPASASPSRLWDTFYGEYVGLIALAMCGIMPRCLALVFSSAISTVDPAQSLRAYTTVWAPCTQDHQAFSGFSPGGAFHRFIVLADHFFVFVGLTAAFLGLLYGTFPRAAESRWGRVLLGGCASTMIAVALGSFADVSRQLADSRVSASQLWTIHHYARYNFGLFGLAMSVVSFAVLSTFLRVRRPRQQPLPGAPADSRVAVAPATPRASLHVQVQGPASAAQEWVDDVGIENQDVATVATTDIGGAEARLAAPGCKVLASDQEGHASSTCWPAALHSLKLGVLVAVLALFSISVAQIHAFLMHSVYREGNALLGMILLQAACKAISIVFRISIIDDLTVRVFVHIASGVYLPMDVGVAADMRFGIDIHIDVQIYVLVVSVS